MRLSRRNLLRDSSAVALGFAGLKALTGCASVNTDLTTEKQAAQKAADAKKKDEKPEKLFDLPKGFTYTVVARFGDVMDDGLISSGAADGMAAFPGPNGKTILVRNHELTDDKKVGPFGEDNRLYKLVDPKRLFDAGDENKFPSHGGTTTILFDTRTQRREVIFQSLLGTIRNCAGGPTPWGSWVTCEETVQQPDGECVRDHGWCFEVPARLTGGLVKPEPLKDMGRFYHEAIAVDPRTGIVYETEDRGDSIMYRFIPKTPGNLIEGGKLQALRVKGQKSFDTRNWYKSTVTPGQTLDVEWVDMEDVHSPDDDMRYTGFFLKGCARFARAEGIWYGRDGIYIACTTGGPARRGQIWRYVPSPEEGTSGEESKPGRIELFVEPNNNNICENCDNITIAPWGDLFLCEDSVGKKNTKEQYVLRVTPFGQVSKFARNTLNDAELAGVCFSPDGSTLFVNLYSPGITVAVTGPWRETTNLGIA